MQKNTGKRMAEMKHRSRITRLGSAAAAALGSAVLLAGALPGSASAACAGGPVSHPFAQFGDNADYVLAPGGSFENGAPGWGLSGAGVVEGNETFLASGSHSLAIEAGGEAVSPPVCVNSEYPTFRFFARQLSGGPRATLSASLRWVDLLGIAVESPAGNVAPTSSWAPSPVMMLGNSVPLWLPGSTLYVQLVLHSAGGGSWAVDDVYIDPYSR
jgi:hypothetical protein